jgi:hypothetical protein
MDIELILTRQLASCLAMPVFIVNPAGDLIFYNEHAEAVLGRRFEDTGPLAVGVWSTLFQPMDENGSPLGPDGLPLVIALTQQRPAHRKICIQGLDGVSRCIEVTAFPVISQTRRMVGAVALFWEDKAAACAS